MSKIHRRPTVVATAVLLAGVAASLAGNVQAIHLDNALPGVGAHLSAIFWPLMLFGVVELLIHTPWLSNWRDWLTRAAVLAMVAGVAAWVSYWHMAHVLSAYGYDVASRYAGPLAADAAMVLAALALNRIGQARRAAAVQDIPTPVQAPTTPVQVDRPVATQADADESADILANPSTYLDMSTPSVADEARTWLDTLADAHGGQEPTLPVPVSPAPASRVKPENVPAPVRDMLNEWAMAGEGRPSVGQVDALIAADQGVSTRTARGWRQVVLPTR